MGSTTLNKKRKLRDADSVAEAVALSKKSKKSKSPAPPVDPPSEDEEEEDDESAAGEGSASEDEEERNGDDESDGGASALEDGDEAGDDDLPKDSAPLLPPTTNSDLFEDLNLSEKTMRAIKEMGFTKMTNIQRSVSTPLRLTVEQRRLTADLGNTPSPRRQGRARCSKDRLRKDAGLPRPRH